MHNQPGRQPEAEPRYVEVNGVRLAIYEQAGGEPAVFLLHATGFHARCWNEITARLPGHRVIAFDARGHGMSDKPAPPYSWRTFGEDAAALANNLRLRGAVGVGHSMGGHAVALAAAMAPDAFSELLLIDPVIFDQKWYRGPGPEMPKVARRNNRWASWEDMFQRYKDRSPFDRWSRKVLLDYCEFGLLPGPPGSGRVVLACPPEIEASIYRYSTDPDANIHLEISRIQIPVRVVRAAGQFKPDDGNFSASPTLPDLAARFPNGSDLRYPDHSHFLPMESPQLMADLILHRETETGY